MAIGSLALTQAIRRWDPNKGGAYRWAHRWITTSLTKAVDASRTIRLPEAVANEAALLAAKMDEIEQIAGRKLTNREREEIAGSRQTFATLPAALASIEEPVFDDKGAALNLGEITADETAPDPHSELLRAEMLNQVAAALAELEPIEQEVVRIRFAFGDEERDTLANLGKRFNVSAEAMRRIEMSALAKLRHPAMPIDLEDLA
jgi:RNA polymerase sigma factor (sigma-70 family)